MGLFSFLAFVSGASIMLIRGIRIAKNSGEEPEKANKKDLKKAGMMFVSAIVFYIVGWISLKH